MRILITGGSGFIGSQLCNALKQAHELIILSRTRKNLGTEIKTIQNLSELAPSEPLNAIINLTGEPIADKRWSPKQKDEITRSRIETTRSLVEFIASTEHKPEVFISGSAIGFYGVEASDEAVDESGKPDTSFSSTLCQEWEALAMQAEQSAVRTCLLRTGIVLGAKGGALSKMLPAFKFGLGGKIGSGQQWMPWVHLDDMVNIIEFCLNNSEIKGPINCTAPSPVTNAEFTQSLAAALKRPSLFNMPSCAIKLLMGQMGEELLLAGKRVVPAKLEQHAFKFQFEHLDEALAEIVS